MKPSTKKGELLTGTFGEMELIKDFLPPPEKLVLKKDKNVKVTLNLKKSSVDIFKAQANKLGGSYQRMMRNLIDHYAQTLTK